MADGQILLTGFSQSPAVVNAIVGQWSGGRGSIETTKVNEFQATKVGLVRGRRPRRRMAAAESCGGNSSPDGHPRCHSYSSVQAGAPVSEHGGRGKAAPGAQGTTGGAAADIPVANGRANNNNNNSNLMFHLPMPLSDDDELSRAARLEFSALSLRPKRIILVRHGQSEGNIDESAYTRIPDSKISLTENGWKQAIEAGKKIRQLIQSDEGDDWKVYFYVSPYRRTLQTLRGIGLAFERERIAGVREEPRIREQDFGNFQDREKMRVEKEVRLRYGRFFYRFPNGESAADVYDRITGKLQGDFKGRC